MTRLENFREKGFFAHAIVSLVKLDKGCSFTPLWTYFYAIGDSLFRYWGLTLSLLGIHFCAIGDSLELFPNVSFVNPQCFFCLPPMIFFVFPQCLSVQTLTVCML